jgi:type I restriction enzyme S subunit
VNNKTLSIDQHQTLLGKDAPSRARKLIKKGDILFATIRPTLQRIAIVPESLDSQVCSTGYYVLRPKSIINHRFLFYFLLTDSFNSRMETLQKGASYPAVNNGEVESQVISYPSSIDEQRQIVAVLDGALSAVNDTIAHTERNLQNCRELFDSYLNALEFEKKPLGNFVNISTGKLNANAAVENGKYPFFTCSREIFAINHYAFDCEAILLAGNNAVGDFNVKHYKGKFNAYQRTYVITVNEKEHILYRFLYFQLLNSLKEFKSKSVGANTKFLKLGMIKDIQISVPSLKEQKQIVQQLDMLKTETKRLEAIYQQKLDALTELKKSILHQAFSGNLT